MTEKEEVAKRLDRERAFHDERFDDDPRQSDRGISLNKRATLYALKRTYDTIRDCAKGCDVLDYGCAQGKSSVLIAGYGAKSIQGIDISSVAIAQAQSLAREEGITNAQFRTMNAEELEFPEDSFDLVCGFGILHHLDLRLAYSEIARVLRSSGRAVFLEPLGHNPAINWYRNRTPQLRTADEHPLLVHDIELAKRFFASVKCQHTNCLSLACFPLAGLPGSHLLFRTLTYADQVMFKLLPYSRRYSWNVILELAQPLPASTTQ